MDSSTEAESRRASRQSKRYSFSFNGLRRSSTQSAGTMGAKRSVSISSPTALNDQQQQELPSQMRNSIYFNENYSDQKRSSYAICQSLSQSLGQSQTVVSMPSGHDVTVPSLVFKCCQYILTHELCEGIFRVNASLKKIRALENMINAKLETHQDFELDEFVSQREEIDEMNTIDAAMILKRYLNNLDDFLVTHDNYHKFAKNHSALADVISSENSSPTVATAEPLISSPSSQHSVLSNSNSQFSEHSHSTSSTKCTDNNNNNNNNDNDHKQQQDQSQETIENVLKTDAHDLIHNIGTIKLDLLSYLLYFLHQITVSESLTSKTKMSSLNLSKIFQPSLFEFKVDKASSTENLLDFYKVNELILWRWIDNYDFLAKCIVEESINVASTTVCENTQTEASPNQDSETEQGTVDRPQIDTLKSDDTIKVLPANTIPAEEKKQRRRSLFGYRSVSSPTPFASSVSGNNEALVTFIPETSAATKSKLKRLPTTIFGSTYSLKSKLASPAATATVMVPDTMPPPSETSADAAMKKTKQRRRRSMYGFEHLRQKKDAAVPVSSPILSSQEFEEEAPDSNTSSFGLQKKPLYGHDIKFNQSPRSSPLLEQSSTFGSTNDKPSITPKSKLPTSGSRNYLRQFLQSVN